jgi:hypothetical protein
MFLASFYWPVLPETATPWDSQEALVLQAAKHVKMAKVQRELFNLKKDEAYSDRDKPKQERTFTFVADYSQNMYLPNFAGSQPGETYYYSPLNAYCFGVVDASQRPAKLFAHTYLEDLGKKGGDNVASLLWKQLKYSGLVPEDNSKPDSAANEINFVFDNCGGQNKNRMVLRLLPLLVKRGICNTARAIFLVRGHTKNDCDRLFNLMKKLYRVSNIYDIPELIKAIGDHDDVSPIAVVDGEFLNIDKMEDKFLKKPVAIKANHIFEVTAADPNSMFFYEFDGAQPKKQELIKPAYKNVDWTDEAMALLTPKAAVGIQDIKWIELHDKWRPLIPLERQTYHYIKEAPPPAIRNKVKKHTGEAKKQRKDRSRTGTEQKAAKKEEPPPAAFGGEQPVASVPNTPQKI